MCLWSRAGFGATSTDGPACSALECLERRGGGCGSRAYVFYRVMQQQHQVWMVVFKYFSVSPVVARVYILPSGHQKKKSSFFCVWVFEQLFSYSQSSDAVVSVWTLRTSTLFFLLIWWYYKRGNVGSRFDGGLELGWRVPQRKRYVQQCLCCVRTRKLSSMYA